MPKAKASIAKDGSWGLKKKRFIGPMPNPAKKRFIGPMPKPAAKPKAAIAKKVRKPRTKVTSTSKYGLTKQQLQVELHSRGVNVREGTKKAVLIRHWRRLNGITRKNQKGGKAIGTRRKVAPSPVY